MQGGSQPRLVMRRGPQPDRSFPIDKDVMTIGRDAANDIVIADPEVSRQHARLVRQAGGGILMEDLGSTNGTTINGTRLTAAQVLNPGDTIGLGDTVTLGFQVTSGLSGETAVGGVVRPFDEPVSPAPATQSAPPPPVAPPAAPPPRQSVYQPPLSQQAPPQWEPAPPPPPPPAAAWQPAPVYAEPVAAPPPDHRMRNVLLGCGCLLMACVLCGVALWAFDYFNLYYLVCQPLGLVCS